MPDETKNTDYRNKVRVFGKNMLAGPLFESSDANTIVMYDSKGEPSVILAKMVDTRWIMGASVDDDWENMKRQFGVY